ncbi:hypothetical protein CCHL11_04685 [Colletotrichum chlorophyti]|uniref:Chromo domain-containing protein n=1 Tax=Colletotrichum chlorophyti TaxID=708187 RepID=A0A1Q8S1Z9_9PEZI|nr:hypothetical protein CCHL11_04685 [Colletotrichum chlorophyti]
MDYSGSCSGGTPDDDAISVNSTLVSEHDSDEEWLVEGIRFQGHEDGKDKYLVEWTGYPIEEATWEPEENVTRELLQEWQDTQAKQARGEEEPFDIAAWQERVDRRQEDSYQRHHKRNVERKRRGLQLKLWDGESKTDYSSSDEGVDHDDYNAVFPPPKPTVRQNETTHTVDNHHLVQSRKQPTADKPDSPRKRTSAVEPLKSPMKQKSPTSDQRQHPNPASAPSIATGYQGTARKLPTSKPVNSTTIVRSVAAATPARMAHKAKKTTVVSRKMMNSHGTVTGINVFAAGKPSKQRRQLVQSVADSSKDPRLFSNHRIKRKAELQGRDKEGQAPPAPPTKLFSISSGPPPSLSTGTAVDLPRSALKRSMDELTVRSASEFSVTPSEKTLLSNMDQTQPPQEQLSSLRKLSIAEYQSRNSGQNVEKSVILGPPGTKEVKVMLENVRHDFDPWHSRFMEQNPLRFDRSFTAHTFASQKASVVGPSLSHGNVTLRRPDDGDALQSAAARLRLGSFGAACFTEEFLVILYPTGCVTWKDVMNEVEAVSPANVALRYIIYKPQPVATNPLPVLGDTLPKATDPYAVILRDVLRLDYHQLIPPGVRDVRHNFYLAFPPSRKSLLDILSTWLHNQNPECRVFSTKTSGDWSAFTNPKIVSQGVVIVHEAAIDTLRRFPGLLKLLLHKNSAAYVFWCIGECLQRHPIYPSVRSIHHQSDPGTFELTRLFPHGNAILVTPSFLVAEPRRALQLFEWYKRTHQKPTSNTKIVAAANLLEFLQAVAVERSKIRDALLTMDDKTRHWSKSAREDAARRAGFGQEDCSARFDICAVVDSLRPPVDTLLVPDEQLEPIIFADESIDAHDEQSLVNFFGCWSQTRLDRFRKFHVLGTAVGFDISHSIRKQDIPRFASGAGQDPGAEPHINISEVVTAEKSRDLQGSGSKILKSMSPQSFIGHLMHLSRTCEGPGAFFKVYGFPVSYSQDVSDTADSCGDFHREFKSFDQWLRFPWPFSSHNQPKHLPPNSVNVGGREVPPQTHPFNSYFAFFYTPDEDSQSKPRRRHPWLAAWRVVEPHKPGWGATELLIWDITAREQNTTEECFESQLTVAQQHLIQLVREHGEEKNPGLPLRKVWLKNHKAELSDYATPLDITLDLFRKILNDVKAHAPAAAAMLPGRGFRRVHQGAPPASGQFNPLEGLNVDPVASHASMNTKTVFHPPRACRPLQSRCVNLFHRWVMGLKKEDPSRRSYRYTFKPTAEWYREQQVAENRHYEHINVATWQRIFEVLRIPTEREGQDGPGRSEERRK